MNIGNLQRRWSETRPAAYDKETRIVALDITLKTSTVQEGEETVERQGYSYIPVEIDTNFDYGHVKSQLIEAGFAQKDEFGLLMNAVDGILSAISASTSFASLKAALDTEDIKAFGDFCAFRAMCAAAAHEVVSQYS